MLDVLTVQEIDLAATFRAEELEAEFQNRFNAPLIRAQLVQAILENPELAQTLQQQAPQQYERVMRQVGRMQAIAKGR